MSAFRLCATGLLVVCFTLFLTAPAHAEEDDTVTAVLKSAGSKGGEVAAKWLAGVLYDSDCKNKNTAGSMSYICKVLGSVSGRVEDEWKADVTKQLGEINSKLDTIQNSQREMQKQLDTTYKKMDAQFNQVAANVIAGTHFVRIDALWEKYQAQFDKIDNDVTRDSMIAFAKDIMKSKPHTILGDLNVVLTTPVLTGQSLIRYPFYEYRTLNETRMIHELNTKELYDFAETKFVDFRSRQQKAYALYLWAASVLQTQCELKPANCMMPPVAVAEFKADFDRHTRQQMDAFNTAVDWFVLNYSTSRNTTSGNFLALKDAQAMYLRANYLTAATLNLEPGLWGRVISMGDKWNGSLQVTCGGAAQTLTPKLTYNVPVAGTGVYNSGPDSGPLDWWVTSQNNSTYDEVHFADNWKIYHYNLPTAKAGPCTIPQNQAGYLPWVLPSVNVVDAMTFDKRAFPFGSFVAIQRAGGSYALLSGSNWQGHREPERVEDGKGQREKVEYEWVIDTNAPTGPRIGVFTKGRAEYKVGNMSSRIHNRNKIALTQSKYIRFPDGQPVKLRFYPNTCGGGPFCIDMGGTTLMMYDIENNDTDAKKGKLEAQAGVGFRDPDIAGLTGGPGVVIDGSYDKTGDHKTRRIEGEQIAVFSPSANKKYQLAYWIYFDLETEGRGWDASVYKYGAHLNTGSVFLTR